jgi:tRNA U54 and U55 pseudouridine synthase Pus10
MTKDNATSEDGVKGEDPKDGEGGDCPLGFGKNGRITEAVDGVKKSMYLAFMSANSPLTKEEVAAKVGNISSIEVTQRGFERTWTERSAFRRYMAHTGRRF